MRTSNGQWKVESGALSSSGRVRSRRRSESRQTWTTLALLPCSIGVLVVMNRSAAGATSSE